MNLGWGIKITPLTIIILIISRIIHLRWIDDPWIDIISIHLMIQRGFHSRHIIHCIHPLIIVVVVVVIIVIKRGFI